MTSQHTKLYVLAIFLTLSLLIPPLSAGDAAADSPAMAKLTPFERELVKVKVVNEGLSPQQQESEAEFINKIKTGAPFTPEEQARYDKFTPEDIKFFKTEIRQYDNLSQKEAEEKLKPDMEYAKAKQLRLSLQNGGPLPDTPAIAKLTPFEKEVVKMKTIKLKLSLKQIDGEAEFLYNMKTGAPLSPEQQAYADKLTPEDVNFYRNELVQFDKMSEKEAQDALKAEMDMVKAEAAGSPDPAQAGGAPPADTPSMAQLTPFEREIIKVKVVNQGLNPQQQECEAQFLVKLKTGAPFTPEEQAKFDKLSPEDQKFLKTDIRQYDNLSAEEAQKKLNPDMEYAKAKQVTASLEKGGQLPDSPAVAKLTPFEKEFIKIKATSLKLTPKQIDGEAEFLYNMKTGAPLTPDQQAYAAKLTPEDADFYKKELKQYDNMSEKEAKDALNELLGGAAPGAAPAAGKR